MYAQNESAQRMINWMEEHLLEDPFLPGLSQHVGYSPYYCSVLFHRVCGMTLKSYAARRRLSLAALELNNSRRRILDIAMDAGFSTQEAFTRTFRTEFGRTPQFYRKHPVPVPLFLSKEVFHPWQYAEQKQTNNEKGGMTMGVENLKEARVRIEYIPAHKYLGIWEDRASGYGDFWSYHNCDQVCGTVESMRDSSHPVVTAHTAGWRYVDGKRRYFYGLGMPEDYSGPIPEGFELKHFPGSYYLVFYHPPFDYMEDNGEVMRRVEDLAWSYNLDQDHMDPSGLSTGSGAGRFQWNEEACQCYQRHYPEGIGYEVLRPVKLK